MVGRHPKAPDAFTLGEIPGIHFQRLSRHQGTWFCRGTTEQIPSDTTGNRSRDRPTSSAASLLPYWPVFNYQMLLASLLTSTLSVTTFL